MYTIFESKMSFQGSFHDNCKMQCHPVQFARMIEHGADIQFQLINIWWCENILISGTGALVQR